ncbi:hypothetical protein V6Z11_D01G095600 [Gossypium hirsutum]
MSKECLEKVTQTISFLAQPRESHLLLLTDLSPFQRQFPLFSIEYRFSSGLTETIHPFNDDFPFFRPNIASRLG